MTTYQLTTNADLITLVDTNTTIPRGHRLWAEYEDWLAAGNTPLPPPGLTFEAILAAVIPGVQAWMDMTARQKGYDSVVSCATYATSTVPEFKADAEAIIRWRDAVWVAAYAWRDGLNGQLPPTVPTIEEVIAQLPQPGAFGWNGEPYTETPPPPEEA
jgi:hypothetical protein